MASFEGVLANIPGYGGYLAKDQLNRRNTLSDLQQIEGLQGLMAKMQAAEQQKAVQGILSDPNIADEERIPALMRAGPAGIEVAGKLAQMQKVQQDAAKARRVEDFLKNEAPKYTTPAQEEIRGQDLPGGLMGPALPGQGRIIREAKPAGTDLEGLLAAGSLAGVYAPDTALKIKNDAENRRAMIEDRKEARRDQLARELETIRVKAEEGRISKAEADARQRELRMMISALGASNRQPPAPTVMTDAEGNVTARNPQTGQLLWEAKGAGKVSANALKAKADLPQARQRVAIMDQNIEKLDTALKELDESPGLSRITGPIAGRVGNLTEDATNAQAKLDSAKAQIFISALQSMREASKTGGAVGNVTDKEGDKLQATLAALDQKQGTPQFRDELRKARHQLARSRQIIREAFTEQYGQSPEAQPSPSGGGSAGGWSVVR